MAEGGSNGSLSSTHWELHRNTLLFSALLLIICVPGAKPATTQSFLWLSFSEVAFNSVRMIVFCAATYAFIAYFLEWRAEPYALLKAENRVAQTLLVRANDLLAEATKKLEPVVNAFERTTRDLTQGVRPYIDNESTHTQDQINVIVRHMYEEISSRPSAFFNPISDFGRNILRLEQNGVELSTTYAIEKGREAIEASALVVANASCTVVAAEAASKINSIMERAVDETRQLRSVMEEFANSRVGLKSIVIRSKIALFAFRSESWLRIGFVGFAIPCIIYATALAHLAGQLDWGHLPSVFDVAKKSSSVNKPKGRGGQSGGQALAPTSTKA